MPTGMHNLKQRTPSTPTNIASKDTSHVTSFELDEKKSGHRVQFWGLDLSNMGRTSQFLVLASGHIFCAIIFAALQEQVFNVLDKSQSQLVTFGTQLVYCVCAQLERYLENDLTPRAPLKSYGILSILTTCGMYFTNWSLMYLSYPARIIFKSAKPLPTMVVESIYPPRKTFSSVEIFGIGLLTVGISFFCFGEVSGSPSFHIIGLVLIFVGVTSDALTSNFEKKNIFKKHNSSHAEVMFYASLFGMFLTLFSMGSQVFNQLAFFITNPASLFYICMSALGGYFSVSFILIMIKAFGPTYAETVKGVRKVISIGMSYVFFPNPSKTFGTYHMIGIFFFILSLLNTIHAKSQK